MSPRNESFQPENGKNATGAATPMFTPIIPASTSCLYLRTAAPDSVKIDVPLPKRLLLTSSIASSSDPARTIASSGPNTSSPRIGSDASTSTIEGPTNASPDSSGVRPSTATDPAPAPASTRSIQSRIRSQAAGEITGPTSVPSSNPSPTRNARVASTNGGISL